MADASLQHARPQAPVTRLPYTRDRSARTHDAPPLYAAAPLPLSSLTIFRCLDTPAHTRCAERLGYRRMLHTMSGGYLPSR